MMKRGAVFTASLLIVVAVAGCLDEISDYLDPPEVDPEEPHNRLEYLIGSRSGAGSCSRSDRNLPSVVGPNCFDIIAMFGEMKCDPAQLWVTDKSNQLEGRTYDSVEMAREAQEGVEGPEDAYLYCEMELHWQFTGRSLMPDSELHVVHATENREFRESCGIPVQSHCTVEMSYIANLTVDKEKKSEVHEEWVEVEIEWFEPLLHEVSQSFMVFESEFWFGVN